MRLTCTAVLLDFALLVASATTALSAGTNAKLIPVVCVCEPPGWPSPLVPRMAADATLAGGFDRPDSLLSTQPTWFNFSTGKNSAVCATWTDALYLDEVAIDLPVNTDCEWTSKYFPHINRAPTLVRGGRHTITAMADVGWSAASDYSFRPAPAIEQLTWCPMPLPPNTDVVSAIAPPRLATLGYEPIPNNDGYQLARANSAAWVVVAFAADSASNVDLGLYVDPWHGSTTGFSVEATRSQQPASWMDFVVGGAGTPAILYPAVISGAGGASGGYALRASDASGRRDSTGGARWSGALAPGEPAAVYEVWLNAGTPFHAGLAHTLGGEALAFSAFPPTPGGIWSRQQALALGPPVTGGEEGTLAFTPTETGWHPIVVFRSRTTGTVGASSYVLQLGGPIAVGTKAGAPRLFLSAPPVANAEARLAFGLASAGKARLAIFDAQGRRVRTLLDASLGAGARQMAWDLRDAGGARVDAGVFWARLDAAGGQRTARMVVLR